MLETKTCITCGEEKPLTEEFYNKTKTTKSGFRGECKACIKQYKEQYYLRNRERLKGKATKYRLNNKEKLMEQYRHYYQQNKEKIAKRCKKHYQDNKERFAECSKKYYQENKAVIIKNNKLWVKDNKEKVRTYKKQYYQENKDNIVDYKRDHFKSNPEIYRASRHRRSARDKNVPRTLTIAQWEQIKDCFNDQCAYCGISEEDHLRIWGQPLHQDHFSPLSNGGGYTQDNIIPACKSCNCSKKAKDFFEWYPSYEHYDKEREVIIIDYFDSIRQSSTL